MASRFRTAVATEAARAALQPAGYPFRGPGVWARTVPFAAIAVVAEASLALPPGPPSMWPTAISVVLLVATAGFFLPWPRLPDWVASLAPLTYTASVLALILAAGSASGVGIVILIPLIWTVLFQRWRDSALVLLAIVIVEVVISLVPVAAPGAVIFRRVVLWAALGAVIVVAAHSLRDRIARAQQETARLEAHLRQVTVLEDRERIAADIRSTALQRLFAVGLNLQGAEAQINESHVRSRVAAAVTELDQAIRAIRDSIFAYERTAADAGLRAEIIGLFTQLSPSSEIKLSGPVDESLSPELQGQLLGALHEAVAAIQGHYVIECLDIAAGVDSFVTVIEASPAGGHQQIQGGFDAQRLRHLATEAGFSLDIVTHATAVRFAWVIPLESAIDRSSTTQP